MENQSRNGIEIKSFCSTDTKHLEKLPQKSEFTFKSSSDLMLGITLKYLTGKKGM